MANDREDWLNKCAEALLPALAEIGTPVDIPFRITCGWPSRSALSRRRQVLGECWGAEVSEDQHVEMFISPVMADAVEVAATVAHELIHAGGLRDHRARFAKQAQALGLDGQPTATVPGEAFKQLIEPVLAELGPYPHAKMSPILKTKKQSTRLLKVECPDCAAEGDPYIVRMSKATIERGTPVCPIHENSMAEVEGD